jgi:hypothetical protein
MNRHPLAFVCGGITALTLLVSPARGADAPAPQEAASLQAQQRTINDLRTVGTAMYLWWKAEMAPRRSEAAHKKAEAFAAESAKSPVTVDLESVPVLSREELAKILVPTYLPAVPEKDGWGNAYEFRLQTKDAEAAHVMALRSAGQDGAFSGSSYRIEGFAAGDPSQDLAWMDGYFIRWPERN